jgi:hypothetical protein
MGWRLHRATNPSSRSTRNISSLKGISNSISSTRSSSQCMVPWVMVLQRPLHSLVMQQCMCL